MNLHLVDINPELVKAWEKEFFQYDDVEILNTDILKVAKNTIVSPANSYGFMDGGIDRLYTEFFGLRPQTELQDLIKHREEGYLPVGASIMVSTGNSKIPFMIAAPTMITPGVIPSSNCFHAMIAVLVAAERNSRVVTDVYCPGLGTLTGRVDVDIAAKEMANAYGKWQAKKTYNKLRHAGLANARPCLGRYKSRESTE